MQQSDYGVTFLGTAGARIMVASQILASGGLWFDFGGTEILLDPGPGTIVQTARRKLKATKLKAIILSHKHLDHSGDVNVMIEAMTEGGFRPGGVLFAPRDALDNDPVVLEIYLFVDQMLGLFKDLTLDFLALAVKGLDPAGKRVCLSLIRA